MEVEGKFFYVIKHIHEKSAMNILNGERLNQKEVNYVCPKHFYLTLLEVLETAIRQEK